MRISWKTTSILLLAAAFVATTVACSDDESSAAQPDFGEVTTVVVVVNPVVNEGSTIDDTTGSERSGLHVAVADHDDLAVHTDSTGLAVLQDVPVGSQILEIEDGEVSLEILAEGELYDVVVSLNDGEASHLIDPVRYPIGGEVVWLSDGDSLEEAIEDERVIFLEPGVYQGGFEVREENVLVFGSWHAEEGPEALIEGDLTVRGEPNRFRSLDIEGEITSRANNFSMSFSHVEGAEVTCVWGKDATGQTHRSRDSRSAFLRFWTTSS